MTEALHSVIERGDLAHLALFLWASGASGLLVWALKELAVSNWRFNDFVSEIARVSRNATPVEIGRSDFETSASSLEAALDMPSAWRQSRAEERATPCCGPAPTSDSTSARDMRCGHFRGRT